MKGYIYSLKNPINNEIFYIGNTMQSLEERLNGHINSIKHYNCAVAIYLFCKGIIPVIELIEFYPNITKHKIRDNERFWIEQFRQWGFPLVNIAGNISKAGWNTNHYKK